MDKYLQKLKTNNPEIEIVEETEHINISKLWNDQSFMCRFNKTNDFKPMEYVIFPKELSALYHPNKNSLEFIFTPLLSDDLFIQRKYNFFYLGLEFKCSFEQPTDTFKLIASSFREKEPFSDTDYRNLIKYRDFYKKKDLPEFIQKYFENRIPINFFIIGDFEKINYDFVSLSKHLNFYTRYFDRHAPVILIYEQEPEGIDYNLPCISNFRKFPDIINFNELDSVLLDLFHVTRKTNNLRLKFIFYFQVLEYCAYYYLNEDLKRRLTKIIKRPDLLNNPNEYSRLLIEEFKDNFKQNDDSQKLEKVIMDYCEWEDIKHEIECNKEYFSKTLDFDGGFSISPLISEKEDFNAPHPSILKNVKSNIEKIRNVLVHIRESRENKIISPSPKNNNLLIPYLYLIQRLAEKVAMQFK